MTTYKKCPVSPFASFVWWFCPYLCKGIFFPPSNFSSSGHSPVGSLFASEEQKKLARDVTYSSATHADQAHDVTDLVKMALLTALCNFLSLI